MRLDHLLSKENRISEQLIQQSYGRYCESSKDENKSDTLSLLRLYVSNEDCQLNNAKNRVKSYLRKERVMHENVLRQFRRVNNTCSYNSLSIAQGRTK